MDKVPVPWLHNYIIFNPTLCVKEGQEEEKILFYYAQDDVSLPHFLNPTVARRHVSRHNNITHNIFCLFVICQYSL